MISEGLALREDLTRRGGVTVTGFTSSRHVARPFAVSVARPAQGADAVRLRDASPGVRSSCRRTGRPQDQGPLMLLRARYDTGRPSNSRCRAANALFNTFAR